VTHGETSGGTVTVKVLHGLLPGHFLRVLKFEIAFPGSVEPLLKNIWMQLNDEPAIALTLEEPLTEWAIKYRDRHYRSLRLGDVVVIGEQAFELGRKGWSPVTLTADQVRCEHGFWARYVPEHLEGVME
jgi:hypothetical protein